MRILSVLALTLVLAGCRSEAPPLVIQTAEVDAGVVSIPALLDEPARWSGQLVTLIAPLAGGPQGRVLVPFLPADETNSSTPDTGRAVWLAEPLPAPVAAQVGEGPIVLKLRGRLSPPGAYGTEGSFPYQFSAQSASLLLPERTTLPNLAANPHSLDSVVLEIEGSLLADAEGAILADEAAPGGIPTSAARQIKLRRTWDDAALEELQQRGDVRYGPVVVVGWWQAGLMTPFMIRPR